MLNIINFFGSPDKLLHIIVNTLIVVFISIINPYLAIATAILCSVGKELYDLIKYKGWNWADLLADFIGIMIGGLIL